jgi:hypothetical protein
MGIDIAIVGVNDVEIEFLGDSCGLTEALLPDHAKADSPCLRFIDPYGDTVFNYLQIPFLINELDETLSLISDKMVATTPAGWGQAGPPTTGMIVAHGRKIVALARRAMQDADRPYVKFIGD